MPKAIGAEGSHGDVQSKGKGATSPGGEGKGHHARSSKKHAVPKAGKQPGTPSVSGLREGVARMFGKGFKP